mmetsp:Transcript_16092/g.20178  ORF Transcript_16092/g.20178 Transcript_16092/m.20178 type:complete len:297 (-) Transcript_16092:181-1071(-)
MGGVPGTLLCFWCKGGCSTARVAGALAFFPPQEESYSLETDPASHKISFIVNPALEPVPFEKVEAVVLTTKRRKVIPAVVYRVDGAKKTIIYSHGNATDLGAMHDRYVGLAKMLKVNVLAYDYTGYGQSSADICTEADTYADIEAVYEWCTQNLCRNPAEDCILYGQSVGGGPSCYLAAKVPVAGVILHSAFLSGIRVFTSNRALACLDIYPNINRIKKVHCPIFIMHGQDDTEIDWAHGVGLYNAVPDEFKREPWWVPGKGHNNICSGDAIPEYYSRLKKFLRSLGPSTSNASIQ